MKKVKFTPLGDVVSINPKCTVSVHPNDSVSFIRMADVSPNSKILQRLEKPYAKVAIGYSQFQEGDVLVAKITPCFENGKGAHAVNLKNYRGCGSTEFHILRPSKAIDAGYLHALTTTAHFRRLGETRMEGSAGQKRVPEAFFKSYPVFLPPLPEQRKIADILGTWDEALEKLDALIAAKQHRKQALMQQLLTGKKRVKGAKGKWKKVRFGDFLDESRIQGSNGASAKKITVKLYGNGVHEKRERMTGSSNTKYYIRKAGQFIYSKLDFLNGAFGIIPDHLNGYESTLDLPSFDVRDLVDIRWLLYFVKRPEFYTQQLDSAAGGRKARRVNPSEFLAMKIDTPSKAEQSAIATILDTADQEITLLQRQRSALEQQKRGLMQQLLTGRIRTNRKQL